MLGFLTLRTVNSGGLYEALGSGAGDCVLRRRWVQLLTGLHAARGSSGSYDVGQLLMTEALSRSLGADCSYAVWHATASEETLTRRGKVFVLPSKAPAAGGYALSSVLLQNIPPR